MLSVLNQGRKNQLIYVYLISFTASPLPFATRKLCLTCFYGRPEGLVINRRDRGPGSLLQADGLRGTSSSADPTPYAPVQIHLGHILFS